MLGLNSEQGCSETAQRSFFQWLQLEPVIAGFAYKFSQCFRDRTSDRLLQKQANI